MRHVHSRDASGFRNAKMGAIFAGAHMAMETHCITGHLEQFVNATAHGNFAKTIRCNQAKRVASERTPMCSALADQPHRLRASNFKAIRIQTYSESEYHCQLWDLDGPPTYEYSRAKQATDAKNAWSTRPYRPSR